MRLIICENGAAMDQHTLLAPPSATAFDAVCSIASAAAYFAVALAALIRAPRDARVRVFALTAAAGAGPYGITALLWEQGGRRTWSTPMALTLALSLMIGSLALFHFTQVFPWRRPWIRRHTVWLRAAYAGVAALTLGAALLMPAPAAGTGETPLPPVEILLLLALVVVIPLVFLLGVVVPFAGLLSLYRSWQAARETRIEPARVTTFWMLMSQMGGGVLAILVIPLLRLAAPDGPWVTIAAALLFACGLLMPLAFAAGIWKYRVLDLDIDASPQ
jgi:hypothetical protein